MSEHMSDVAFGKVFAGMIAGMVALTIVLIVLAYTVGGEAGSQKSDVQIGASDQETSARTTPVGSVAVGEITEVAVAPEGPVSGESVYQASCVACHAAGVAGAPKYGDATAWEPRIAQGIEVLYDHSINGFNTMPAKGGNTSLSDDAVKAAVDYMIGQESSTQSSATQLGAQSQETSESTGDTTQDVAASPSNSAAGQDVYTASCAVCHAAGVAGAPKLGDVEMWQPRLAQGVEALYDHAINGFNTMPAKGGNVSLSDDDVRAAVDHMLNSVN